MALSALVGCNHPPTAAGPAQFEVIQAPPRAGLPQRPLIDTIRVRLVDGESRDPRTGVPVFWSITEGNDHFTALSDRTERVPGRSHDLLGRRWHRSAPSSSAT
jgi:hypothetical protein